MGEKKSHWAVVIASVREEVYVFHNVTELKAHQLARKKWRNDHIPRIKEIRDVEARFKED